MSKYIESNQATVQDDKTLPVITSDSESQINLWEARAKREGIKPAFLAKVEVLNEAIRDIGLGRFQYELFITAGMFDIYGKYGAKVDGVKGLDGLRTIYVSQEKDRLRMRLII